MALTLVVMVGMLIHLPSGAADQSQLPADEFFALSGPEAAGFVVPSDTRLARDLPLGN